MHLIVRNLLQKWYILMQTKCVSHKVILNKTLYSMEKLHPHYYLVILSLCSLRSFSTDTVAQLSWLSVCKFNIWAKTSFESSLIMFCTGTSSPSLGDAQEDDRDISLEYSCAATFVFFDVMRTFSKSVCVSGRGAWKCTEHLSQWSHNMSSIKSNPVNSNNCKYFLWP